MSKPIFDQPYGLKYQVDGIRMELSWRPDFGAEKTAALQKAQFALAQEAARLIDSYVPFDTGQLKTAFRPHPTTKRDCWSTIPLMPASSITSMPRAPTCAAGTALMMKAAPGRRTNTRVCAAPTGASGHLPMWAKHLALFGAKAVTTFWGGMGHL